MGIYDFVGGILVGIIFACVSYVLQTAQVAAIRGTLPSGASSIVRRHPTQHRFLQEVGNQIHVLKLAGFLFVSLPLATSLPKFFLILIATVRDNRWG